MSKSIQSGRVKQKAQTRTNILSAAKALLKTKKPFTLEEVAKKAAISRATIYRYYSNIDLLTMEATLEINHKTPSEFHEEVQDLNLEDRLFYIQKQSNEFAFKNEIVFRRYISTVLAESITSKEKLRGARRVKVLHKALEPFEDTLQPETLEKLKNTATVLMGMDPIITCKDVCDLSNEEAQETLAWALQMILKGIAATAVR